MKRLSPILTPLALGLLLPACSGQKGDKDVVYNEIEDTSAPRVVRDLRVDAIAPTSAEFVVAFNEAATGAAVVSAGDSLQLTHADVVSNSGSIALSTQAFATSRIYTDELTPETDYRLYLSAEDEFGNRLASPLFVDFTTPAEIAEIPLSGTPAIMREGVPWEFSPADLPLGCTLRLVSGPPWLTVKDTKVVGVPLWQPGSNSVAFALELQGMSCRGAKSFAARIRGDALFKTAWHLNPKAVHNYSWLTSAPAIDIGWQQAMAQGWSGSGVSVGIVDSGMQLNHPDLKTNINEKLNINLDFLLGGCQVCEPRDTTPPLVPGDTGDQGTAVAGIIAATGWNGIGSRGVAPGTRISAYNLSSPRFTPTTNDYLRIFSLKTDIVAHSATQGKEVLLTQPDIEFMSYDRAQKNKVDLGRDGRGTIFLKAAGDLADRRGSAVYDQRSATAWGMVIGSFNNMGTKSAAANAGPNIWISAPGGEPGYQSDPAAFSVAIDQRRFYPGLTTTDIFTKDYPCSVGFAKDPEYFQDGEIDPTAFSLGHSSGFNLGWHEENLDCQYTATLPATPAATATVAGAVAILLEVNPALTWRDVKYILAKSAKRIDPGRSAEVTSIGGSLYEKSLPWVRNAAGFWFHNWYGFGALDIEEAIKIAQRKQDFDRPPLFDTNWMLASDTFLRIPIANIGGIFSDFTNIHNLIVESVQVRVDVSHENIGSLGFELISPSGTRTILKPVQDGGSFGNLKEFVFLANAFYGERALGEWQVRAVDGKEGARPGTLNSWAMRFTGYRLSEER